MHITVKFFASLREQLGCSEKSLELQKPQSVLEVWQQVCEFELPHNTLMAINQEYVSAQAMVNDGDEVAFFPPVTGG